MIDGSVFFIAFQFCSRLYWTRPHFCSVLLCCGIQSKFIEWMCIFTSHTGLWLDFICSLVRYIFVSSQISFDSDWISTLRRQWRREMVDDGVVLSPEFYIWEMQLPTCSSVVWLISMWCTDHGAPVHVLEDYHRDCRTWPCLVLSIAKRELILYVWSIKRSLFTKFFHGWV